MAIKIALKEYCKVSVKTNETCRFKGVFPALLTPFDKDDKINEKALGSLIRMNLAQGVDGFYIGGSTAEFLLLSNEERKKLLDITMDAVKGRADVIFHVGSVSTSNAVELAEYAESVGADAISAVPPFYYKFSSQEIQNHYFDIAKSTRLPILLYYFPTFSEVSFSFKEISEFLSTESFCGVKFTSNDFYMMERIKHAFPEKSVLNGYDEMFMAGLSMGADGGIGSTYNFMADKFIAIKSLLSKGCLEEAQIIQAQINSIIKVLIDVGVFAAEKIILNAMGFDFGRCRRPFKELTSDEIEYVIKTVMPLLTSTDDNKTVI